MAGYNAAACRTISEQLANDSGGHVGRVIDLSNSQSWQPPPQPYPPPEWQQAWALQEIRDVLREIRDELHEANRLTRTDASYFSEPELTPEEQAQQEAQRQAWLARLG